MTDQEVLKSLAAEISVAESHLETARRKRDSMFIKLYDKRKMSVTEMARCAGIRRESVHEAINKQKQRRKG